MLNNFLRNFCFQILLFLLLIFQPDGWFQLQCVWFANELCHLTSGLTFCLFSTEVSILFQRCTNIYFFSVAECLPQLPSSFDCSLLAFLLLSSSRWSMYLDLAVLAAFRNSFDLKAHNHRSSSAQTLYLPSCCMFLPLCLQKTPFQPLPVHDTKGGTFPCRSVGPGPYDSRINNDLLHPYCILFNECWAIYSNLKIMPFFSLKRNARRRQSSHNLMLWPYQFKTFHLAFSFSVIWERQLLLPHPLKECCLKECFAKWWRLHVQRRNLRKSRVCARACVNVKRCMDLRR